MHQATLRRKLRICTLIQRRISYSSSLPPLVILSLILCVTHTEIQATEITLSHVQFRHPAFINTEHLWHAYSTPAKCLALVNDSV